MYSTCLHCQKPLGANAAIEHLPIGRRVAFDGHKGRLWVVCGKCGRWNLVPFEDRWEALEECEEAYRGATQRASTGQIALARLSEGLDLVRIGEPLRPEFAAWRYGEFMRARARRYQRNVLLGLGIGFPVATVGFLTVGFLGISTGGIVPIAANLLGWGRHLLVPALTLRGRQGERIRLTEIQLANSRFEREASGLFVVRLERKRGAETWLYGDAAERALLSILAKHNRAARDNDLKYAVRELDSEGGVSRYLDAANDLIKFKSRAVAHDPISSLTQISAIRRHRSLALEMALHEDTERRAMEGELHLLLNAWREAEELAGISDQLTIPAPVSKRLDELKRG